MNGIDRYREIKDAKARWTALGLPDDISADPLVISNARPEQREEIIAIAKALGIRRLTFFSLPDNGRRPPKTKSI